MEPWVFVIIWAVVIALAIVIEIETFSLVSAWFIGGGLVALTVALIDWLAATNSWWVGWVMQIIYFIIVSLGLLVGIRPFTKKFLKSPTVPTNADVHLGKKFKLLSDVKSGRSSVSINDVVWTVQVDCDCKAGETVILKEISGNKYMAECAKKATAAAGAEKSVAAEEPAKKAKAKGGK